MGFTWDFYMGSTYQVLTTKWTHNQKICGRYLFFGKRRRYLVTFKMQRMLFSFSKKGRHISPTMYFFPILQQYNYVLFLSYDKLHSPLFGDRSAKNLKELLTYERRLGYTIAATKSCCNCWFDCIDFYHYLLPINANFIWNTRSIGLYIKNR